MHAKKMIVTIHSFDRDPTFCCLALELMAKHESYYYLFIS